MTPGYTRAQLVEALKPEIERHELNITAVLVLHSLIEQIVPHGPLKRVPKPLNISEKDLACLVKRDPRQVRYAVEDLLNADLIGKVPLRETDSQGRVTFSRECFDIEPLLHRFGFTR